MSTVFLQFWGGLFYLLNKVFLSRAERATKENRKMWRMWSWIVYLAGVAPWVIILIKERNWMLAAVETGGVPAMLLGLITTIQNKKSGKFKWLDHFAQWSAIVGISYSLLFDFHGIPLFNKVFELGTVIGFLVGTYLLAKTYFSEGYIFFMLMNVSNGILMATEHYPWLALQQILSLFFIIDAWLIYRKRFYLIHV